MKFYINNKEMSEKSVLENIRIFSDASSKSSYSRRDEGKDR